MPANIHTHLALNCLAITHWMRRTTGCRHFCSVPLAPSLRLGISLAFHPFFPTNSHYFLSSQPTSPPNLNWPSVGGRHSPLGIVRFDGPQIKLERDPAALTKRLQFWRKLAKMRGYKRVQGFPRAV